MQYVTTRIVVTDTKLFNRTGDFGRWAANVERAFTTNAIIEAPTGRDSNRIHKSRANALFPVGSLKASIRGDVDRVAVRHFQTTISVNVPYAIYVLKGTNRIYSKSARIPAGTRDADGRPLGGQFTPLGYEGAFSGGMYLPGNPGWGAARVRRSVAGQSANPFLDRAYAKTARTHSSLRGNIMLGLLSGGGYL